MSNKVMVIKAGKNKFKVMVDFIQYGVEYSTQELADEQAKQLKERYKI